MIYEYQARLLTIASASELAQMGIKLEDRFPRAEQLALKARDMAIEMEHLYRAQNAEYSLGVIYEQQGRFKEATIAFHKHIELRDSLMGDEQREELARLEMQYELGKRDAETAAQIQRHRAERNSMIAGGVALLLVAAGGFFIYKQRQEGLRRQQDVSFRATLSETEMKILRLQMNPHFIFNSLNSISDYISKNDIEKADYYLAKFAKLTRGILENSAETLIPLSEELTMIEAYMQLEASRLNGKFTYEIHIADDLDTEKVEIPPLILQPFVENSIWHGISSKEGQGKITIEVTRDNQMYQCVIEDDGVGRYGQDSAAPSAGTRKSYGVSITQDRIAMLNKLQHANASVHIIDLEKGTRVEVNLPLRYEAL